MSSLGYHLLLAGFRIRVLFGNIRALEIALGSAGGHSTRLTQRMSPQIFLKSDVDASVQSETHMQRKPSSLFRSSELVRDEAVDPRRKCVVRLVGWPFPARIVALSELASTNCITRASSQFGDPNYNDAKAIK